MTQDTALDILKTGVSVFLTGSAGTGKTYVINKYISFLRASGISYAVTASTGIAATHIGGMTIHSWSGIGIRSELSPYDIDSIESKQYLYKRLTKTDVLIIDEVSMLPSYMLDILDTLLQSIRKNENPFGGMQIICSGDFFQLPPITRSREVSVDDFVFSSKSWRILDPLVCYLTDQYRQTEGDLTYILESIRSGEHDDGLFELLQSRKDVEHEGSYTRLYTHNVDVDSENQKELSKINGTQKMYEMVSSGKDALVLGLKKNCLAPEKLVLKLGARVMFVKNDPEHAYMNGTLGEVEGFSKDGFPVVLLNSGKEITALPIDWTIEEEGKVRASITQVPLRLAWAITIHKSQGMSLDYASIDLSKAFTFGQGYVALSRLRSIEGLSLSGFSHQALLVHPEVMVYDKTLKELSSLAEHAFTSFSLEEQEIRQKNFVLRVGGTWPLENSFEEVGKNTSLSTYDETRKLLVESHTFEEVVEKRGLTRGTILKHCEVLKEQKELPDLSRFHLIDMDKVEIINNTFKELKTTKMTPVMEYLKQADFDVTFDELRIARLFA